MTNPFTPFYDLYAPNAHPVLPWWHRETNGINTRWVRADRTWVVQVNPNTTGDILVKREDLGELDDETLRLREGRGFHPFGGNIPSAARGAVIERVCIAPLREGTRMRFVESEFSGHFVPQKAEELSAYVDAVLLRLERELPMPRPPIWAGQCWSLPGTFEGKPFFLTNTHEAEGQPWVGALLYGPTKYGRDVPWLHPSLLHPSS